MQSNHDIIEWQDLGAVPYREAWSLQDELREKRVNGEIADRFLIVEHPAVITLGRRECGSDILSPAATLESEGIEVVQSNRGGRATYHGPGQIVGYFICGLEGFGIGIKEFVRSIEQMCIDALVEFKIECNRDDDHPGLWVGRNKIVAIGLNVQHGITQHGFALNHECDLSAFRHIIACGINDRGVTSVASLVERPPARKEIVNSLIKNAGMVFARKMVEMRTL